MKLHAFQLYLKRSMLSVTFEKEAIALNNHCFTSKGTGPHHRKSNQYWLIGQICVTSILYNLDILHFMYRLPLKTWAYILSRQCLTWPFKLIMCQNYPMFNAAVLCIDSEN